jgi:hypothetical protein
MLRIAALSLIAACSSGAAVQTDVSPVHAASSAVGCGVDMTGSLMDLMAQASTAISQHAGASTDAVAVPSPADRDAFASLVVQVLDGDDAAACALPPSYQLLRWVDPQAGALRVVIEQTPVLFYGTYAANPAPTRQLAVEAPHPISDTRTELQSTAVFVQTGARFLAVAGSHRCADTAASGCTGTTTACGAAAPYRISDTAHTDTLPFYAVHALLSEQDPALVFLQLHGNSDAPCPDALVSDSSGTWSDTDPAGRLAAALTAGGIGVGKCGQGFPITGCNLCGTDNVEARESAGAADACTQLGTTYGRFVHVEQHLTLRTAPYQAMVDAVRAAFP